MTSRLTSKKHTLDSDEEDNEEIKKSREDGFEGEEEGNVDIEEGVRFTPFHMRNEMEEGFFDESGMFIFNKNKDKIVDHWIEDVNWSDVKAMERSLKAKKEKEKLNDKEEDNDEELEEKEVIERMLELMFAGENVTQTIKRLGKNFKKSNKGLSKQAKKPNNVSSDEEKEKTNLSNFISYADRLLSGGFMSVYQCSYENLKRKIKELDKQEDKKLASDPCDMFAPEENSITPETLKKEEKFSKLDDEVKWQFRWKNEDTEEVHGPFSSQQMQSWVSEGYFKDGVFVRKYQNNDEKFYSSKRIDFDLFI